MKCGDLTVRSSNKGRRWGPGGGFGHNTSRNSKQQTQNQTGKVTRFPNVVNVTKRNTEVV
ncbi:hypothetical protein DSO57_1000581 [Entomophthora muscae]|uniref:Uncharacterized protein n=2 Tax=Entomophthora muscae TaxID=34485 RepID=A0ACC2SBF9_9FUNG|nr:hypothetical protein DSO57_1000580 [Entomophthora muscae]KAJ9059623.1 hypothetical protein DSO57_1000581 [Entomophthora muscae]